MNGQILGYIKSQNVTWNIFSNYPSFSWKNPTPLVTARSANKQEKEWTRKVQNIIQLETY